MSEPATGAALRPPLEVVAVESTPLFVGDESRPQQVVRVRIAGAGADSPVRVSGDALGSGQADGTGAAVIEAAVGPTDDPVGTRRTLRLTVRNGDRDVEAAGTLEVAEPGWTVHLVSHFHYDPVWWNTQAGFTTEWDELPVASAAREFSGQHTAFDLVAMHLDLADTDPDYKFVLSEVDYLKPYWDSRPQDRDRIRAHLRSGRLDLVGGTYNEPNTNLTGAELTIRNAVYGSAYHRDVLGGHPRTAWQLDAFGHDPQFPGLMADVGLRYSSWARGPFHEWGPMIDKGGVPSFDQPPPALQFASEFEWLSPSGRGVATSYMIAHYSAGWWMDAAPTLADAEDELLRLFLLLQPTTATRNLLLPVGTDHVRPNKWLTRIHRDWAARYVWPRFRCSTPAEFFDAVERSLADRGVRLVPQTRDMNPIFPGKDVSYIDTKLAQRAAECLLLDAEKFATLAAASGLAAYPHDSIDVAWRQLIYGAHHDAITGSESDQVYVDLLTSWRDAWTLARRVYRDCLDVIVDATPHPAAGASVTVVNPQSYERTGVVDFAYADAVPVDADGVALPAAVEDGRLQVLARDLPPTGLRTYRLESPDAGRELAWRAVSTTTIQNEFFVLTVDPARGGCVTELLDRRTGRRLITPGGLGNELLVYAEYPEHPVHHQLGPWLILPTGAAPLRSADAVDVRVRAEQSELGMRIVVDGELGPLAYTQTITLRAGLRQVSCRTRLRRFSGADQLVRLRWPCDVPGALPVSEIAHGVIGRGFGDPHSDAAQQEWTLDNPANQWFALSSTATVRVSDGNGAHRTVPMGIAEVVCADEALLRDGSRQLVVALARSGVTCTNAPADGPRYGDLALDSNRPDMRIALGGPEVNSFVRDLFAASPLDYVAELDEQLARRGFATVVIASAHRTRADAFGAGRAVTGVADLPVLVVAGDLTRAIDALATDLGDHRIEVTQTVGFDALPADFEDYTVGLVNRGVPGFVVDTDGALYLSLLRSCTGWPSGIWIDPPTRTTPDGSGFQLQHWTHDIDYDLVCGPGDWRAARLVRAGHDANHDLAAVVRDTRPADGAPAEQSLLAVEPAAASVLVSSVKPVGCAYAGGDAPASEIDTVAVRLYEAHGNDSRVELRATALGGPVVELDAAERAVPSASSPAQQLHVGGHGFATYGLRARSPVRAAPTAEPASGPGVFSRYWLHNVGPAPAGDHPHAVTLGPRLRRSGEHLEATATVSSTRTSGIRSGTLSIHRADEESTAGEAIPVQRVRIDAEGWLTRRGVFPAPDHGPVVVVAELVLDGYRTFDVGWYDPVTLRQLPSSTLRDLVDTAWATATVDAAAGSRPGVALDVHNRSTVPLVGTIEFVSPWGSWHWTEQWRQDLRVNPGASTRTVVTLVTEARDAGLSTWLLAKITTYGLIHYSDTIRVELT